MDCAFARSNWSANHTAYGSAITTAVLHSDISADNAAQCSTVLSPVCAAKHAAIITAYRAASSCADYSTFFATIETAIKTA